jgi:hypothetical protein
MERLRNYVYRGAPPAPDSVAESSRFSKPERRRIKYTQPKSWFEFLFYVEEKSAMLPPYWSILDGGEEGDYKEL